MHHIILNERCVGIDTLYLQRNYRESFKNIQTEALQREISALRTHNMYRSSHRSSQWVLIAEVAQVLLSPTIKQAGKKLKIILTCFSANASFPAVYLAFRVFMYLKADALLMEKWSLKNARFLMAEILIKPNF
jgi:hypothetical protein